MNLNGDNIILRPFCKEWAGVIKEWYYSGDYPRYFRHWSHILTDDEFINFEQTFGKCLFLVKQGQPIGLIGISNIMEVAKVCHLMTLIDKKHESQGLMLEACFLFGRYLFCDLNYRKLVANIVADDVATKRGLLRGGFIHECTLIQECKVNGKVMDEDRLYMTDEMYFKLYGGA